MHNHFYKYFIQIVLTNSLILFIVYWFGLSTNTVVGLLLINLAVIGSVATVIMTRRTYYENNYLSKNSIAWILITILCLGSLLTFAYAYTFIIYDIRQALIVKINVVFITILTISIFLSLSNKISIKLGRSVALALTELSERKIFILVSLFLFIFFAFFYLHFFFTTSNIPEIVKVTGLLIVKILIELAIWNEIRSWKQ